MARRVKQADRMKYVKPFGVLGLAIMACSGRVADGSSVDPAQAAAYCQATVNYYATCGHPLASGYCDSYIQCIQSIFRAEIIPDLIQCVQELPCGQSESACVESISTANIGAVFSEYKSACESRLAACESEFTTDDQHFFCFEDELGVSSDTYIQQTKSCLEKDCNSIRGCMEFLSARSHCKG